MTSTPPPPQHTMSRPREGTARRRPQYSGVEECKGFDPPKVSPSPAGVLLAPVDFNAAWRRCTSKQRLQVSLVKQATLDAGSYPRRRQQLVPRELARSEAKSGVAGEALRQQQLLRAVGEPTMYWKCFRRQHYSSTRNGCYKNERGL